MMRLIGSRMAVAVQSRMTSPLFSFGIIADIQYADRERVVGRDRFERDAIVKLRKTIDHWTLYDRTVQPLKCIVNLGDIIDGHEGEDAVLKDKRDLLNVIRAFENIHIPKYHVLGNHCVWNLGCEYTQAALQMPHRYYDIPIHSSNTNSLDDNNDSKAVKNERQGWRFVFLDGTDLSLMKDSHSMLEAQAYFKLHSHRMLEDWNGGFSQKQMKWLKNIFEEAKQQKEKLILFCHWPLINMWSSEFSGSLLWNAEEVLQMLDPEVVFMFMSGHMHENGYKLHNGIHHLTLGAIVTTKEGEQAHGVVHVGDDSVEIEGFGVLETMSQSFQLQNNSNNVNNTCNTSDVARLE